MSSTTDVTLDRGWVMVLRDVGIDPEDVLRLATLPLGMLGAETTRLTVDEYFRMARAIEELGNDPLLAIRLGRASSPETFSAPIFAALCSSTLAVAVERIATHKRLIAPMSLTVDHAPDRMTVSWAWDDPSIEPPRLLMATELVFLIHLARIATRHPVQALHVTCPVKLEPDDPFREFFGTEPVVDGTLSLTFSAIDAHRPFLTASEALWATFEPELQRRTNKLVSDVSMTERTRSVLLECLPSGESAISDTARRLGISSRTLQRRLADEQVTFREIVQTTRERLAFHYIRNTALTYREIAFLLGYDESSSFFRAFHDWSGQTPQFVRTATR